MLHVCRRMLRMLTYAACVLTYAACVLTYAACVLTYAATRELRELRIREELQGELHPRTQQARRKYMTMIEERLKTKGLNYSAIDIAIETQSAESGNASTVVVAKMLSEQVVSSLRPHTLVA